MTHRGQGRLAAQARHAATDKGFGINTTQGQGDVPVDGDGSGTINTDVHTACHALHDQTRAVIGQITQGGTPDMGHMAQTFDRIDTVLAGLDNGPVAALSMKSGGVHRLGGAELAAIETLMQQVMTGVAHLSTLVAQVAAGLAQPDSVDGPSGMDAVVLHPSMTLGDEQTARQATQAPDAALRVLERLEQVLSALMIMAGALPELAASRGMPTAAHRFADATGTGDIIYDSHQKVLFGHQGRLQVETDRDVGMSVMDLLHRMPA